MDPNVHSSVLYYKKKFKQLECSSIKLWHVDTVEFYPAMKMNKHVRVYKEGI